MDKPLEYQFQQPSLNIRRLDVKLDLTEQEKTKYKKLLNEHAQIAQDCAGCLDDEDSLNFMVKFMDLTFSIMKLKPFAESITTSGKAPN